MTNIRKNNQTKVVGRVAAEFTFSHQVHDEKFFGTELLVPRISGVMDVIPIIVSDKSLDVNSEWTGKLLWVFGRFQSFNKHQSDGRNKVELYVFVTDAEVLDECETIPEPEKNFVFLEGYFCKSPAFRVTPLGRKITDILLAVNTPFGQSDYLPCVCWGRDAKYAIRFEVGTKCTIEGRIQSRTYTKVLPDGSTEERIAREVSVTAIRFDIPEGGSDSNV